MLQASLGPVFMRVANEPVSMPDVYSCCLPVTFAVVRVACTSSDLARLLLCCCNAARFPGNMSYLVWNVRCEQIGESTFCTPVAGESKVILCVMQSSQDLATQGALKIAQELDPGGKRTLGVITKIDLQPQGLREKLLPTGANAIRLELGCVGVSQFTARASSDA